MEEALRIRRKHLEPDDEELANSVSNLGNIECAEDNLNEALQLFTEAENIRTKLGEEGAIPLAITYLTKGRAHYLSGDFDEALENYGQAETIAVRFAGRNSIVVAKYNIILPTDRVATYTAQCSLRNRQPRTFTKKFARSKTTL